MTPSERAARVERFDRWYDYPRAVRPRLSHDGTVVYVISDRSGIPLAWELPRAGGTLRPYFGGAERVGQVVPRPNGPETVVSVDRGGNEHWELVLADRDGRPVRPLSSDPSRIHTAGAWGDRGDFYFSANTRDVRFFDLYRTDALDGGATTRLRTEDALVDVADARGNDVLVLRSNTNLDRDIFLLRETRETNLLPHDREVTVYTAAFGEDRVFAAANPERELTALFALSRSGRSPELLAAPPGDVEVVEVGKSGRTIAFAYNDRGYSRISVYDLDRATASEIDLPEPGVVGSLAASPDGEEYLFDLSSPTLGSEVFAFAPSSGTVRQLSHAAVPFPGPRVRPSLHEVTASDGLRIPYWRWEPATPARATIVYVHGGPEAQARPQFLPLFGFLLGEGFRLIAPNVRGSLGYGRRYVHLDDKRRRMDSVRDLAEVVGGLFEAGSTGGLGAGHRVGVLGGSYGGFMVLSSITTYPELFEAAVDVVGIANFVTFLERTGPWRRKVREDEYGSLADDREFLSSISPVHHADRIRTPLMVVHGENDPRVPLFEAEQIVSALREHAVPVEFLRFADEGHGLVRRPNQRETYVRAAEFFATHLGERG